jgi:hypothetical protein
MTRLLTAVMIAAPIPAMAHDLSFVHAHPHGIEVVLGAFTIIAAASFAGWRLGAGRRRRDGGK